VAQDHDDEALRRDWVARYDVTLQAHDEAGITATWSRPRNSASNEARATITVTITGESWLAVDATTQSRFYECTLASDLNVVRGRLSYRFN